MTKKFLIKGETPEGKKFEHKVEFTSCENGTLYGRRDCGYIDVTVNGDDHAYLDCRYESGTFYELCRAYLYSYWGNNLKSFEEVE